MKKQHSRASKAVQTAFVAIFLLLCLLPSLGMLIWGESKNGANEILSAKPVLVQKNGRINRGFLSDFSDYMADRFAFRRQLANAWAVFNAKVFGASVEDQVILGSDDWLYFSSSLDDYMGRGMSEEELDRTAKKLAELQSEAESRGARFLFTIAPNKNSLYSEHMPSHIPAAHENANAVRLKPYLEQYGVHYLNLFSLFSEREEVLYYCGDSHWTDRGAALAADVILREAGLQGDYFNGPFTESEPHRGDLYEMLYPTGESRECAETYAYGFSYTFQSDSGIKADSMKIHTACGEAGGQLICWRDSFGNSLYPYLADSFSEAFFLRDKHYDMSLIDESGDCTVLIEIVERELPSIIAYNA